MHVHSMAQVSPPSPPPPSQAWAPGHLVTLMSAWADVGFSPQPALLDDISLILHTRLAELDAAHLPRALLAHTKLQPHQPQLFVAAALPRLLGQVWARMHACMYEDG